MKSETGVT